MKRSRQRDAAVLVGYPIALIVAGYLLRHNSTGAFAGVMLVFSMVAGAALGRFSWLYVVLFVEWFASVIFASYVQVLPPDKDEGLFIIAFIPFFWALVIGSYMLGVIARNGVTTLWSSRARRRIKHA